MHADVNGNGDKVHLRLGIKDIATIIGFFAVFFAVLMYVFQPRTKAVEEHAAIVLKVELQKQSSVQYAVEQEKKEKAVKKRLDVQQETLNTIHTNQVKLMTREGMRRRDIKQLPANARDGFE